MLTVKQIEALVPGPKRREVPDGKIGSLYLVLQPSGARSWCIRYRHNGGMRKLTLGPWPALGLAEARDRAVDELRVAKRGGDPAAERKAARQSLDRQRRLVFAKVAEDFIKRSVAGKKTAATIEANIRRVLIPRFGHRPVAAITRADIVALVETIVDRGHKAMARQILGIARKLFRWAVNRGTYDIQHSPCEGISPNELIGRRTMRSHVLTDREIRLVWKAAGEIGYPFGTCVRLLLVTGQRRGEVSGVSRSELNLDHALWTIPARRMKGNAPHEVPLSRLALDLFQSLPKFTEGPYLLTATAGRRPIVGFGLYKQKLDATVLMMLRRELGLRPNDPIPAEQVVVPFTLHDLRRTMRSRLSGLPIPTEIRELMIAHAPPQLHQIYDQHHHREAKARGFELWARALLDMVDGPRPPRRLRAVS